MNKRLWIFGVLSIMMVSGCALTQKVGTGEKMPVEPLPIIAKYTEKPVVVDGKLDDPVWKNTPVYKLSLSRADEEKGNILQEEGYVQLAWNENYLYIGIKFYDSDITQENEENQQHHYRNGDLVELFLKPEKNTWYWEIYGTPNGKKTVFWFPGRGRLGMESHYQAVMNLDDIFIGVQIKGTLNNWKDRDDYWTLEMAIPVKELTKYGDAFGPGSEWRILIARYNYSRYLPWKELSMIPQLSMTNYHLLEEYGRLVFEK